MRPPAGGQIDVRCAVAEAVGTFFLVFVGPGAAVVDQLTGGVIGHVGISLAFALVVLAMIYALGHLSGAHINPAVTVGFWVAGRFPGRAVLSYVTAQCTGALAAAGLLAVLLGPVTAAVTVPTIPHGAAFGIEWVLSFALMFVIMAVATDARVADGFAPIAVGLTVGFAALMGGALTGASINPARSFGPALVDGSWTAHWIYWLAPLTAMGAAARAYEWLRPAAAPHGVPTGVQGPI